MLIPLSPILQADIKIILGYNFVASLKTKNYYNYENGGQHFVQQCFLKLCTKFQGKRASRSGAGSWHLGNMTTYDFYLFCFQFIIIFWRSSFNLATYTCSFYWWYIFPFENSWSKNINRDWKAHVVLKLLTIEEHNKKKNRELEKVERSNIRR